MKIIYREFEIKSIFSGKKHAPWNDENFNQNIIYVCNVNTNDKISFDFWQSKTKKCKGIINENELMFAFYRFLIDGICCINGFERFCNDLGYNEYDKESKKIFMKCMNSFKKMEKIGINEQKCYDIMNEISEKYEL